MKNKKIAVIGAGMSGLTLTYALQKAGFDVKLFEAAPQIKHLGAGIWLAPNALKVFERLGIVQPILALGEELNSIEIVNYKGKLLQKMDMRKLKQRLGQGTVSLLRSSLSHFLYEQLDKNRVFTNKKVKSLANTEDLVMIHFDDGSTDEVDILIGADGVRSTIREHLFGHIPLRYSGQTCWRFVANIANDSTLHNRGIEYWGHINGLRFGMSPISATQAYCFAVMKTEEGQTDAPETIKEHLLELYSEFDTPVIQAINSVQGAQIRRSDLFDLKPIPQWWRGSITLVGDAAHPSTPNLGQGAAQAIEDAYVLVTCLQNANNAQEAFAQFQQTRYRKAVRVVNDSYRFGKINNFDSRLMNTMRNLVAWATPTFLADKQTEWIYETNY